MHLVRHTKCNKKSMCEGWEKTIFLRDLPEEVSAQAIHLYPGIAEIACSLPCWQERSKKSNAVACKLVDGENAWKGTSHVGQTEYESCTATLRRPSIRDAICKGSLWHRGQASWSGACATLRRIIFREPAAFDSLESPFSC